jgi:cyclic beta-1,2-glucan synthetase
VSGPWIMLWFLSPVFGWLLSRRPTIKQPKLLLPTEDRQFLRRVARLTWRYFSDFVTEMTSWLPPDNYQVSYQDKLALRTSPTNIGLYMISVLSAYDFGYVTVDEVTQRLTRTMGLLVGVEGPGVPERFRQKRLIGIPMEAGSESLNAAVSAAVAMYEWYRRHHTK